MDKIIAFNVKAKEKQPMQKGAVISVTKNGRYFCKGHSASKGHEKDTLCVAMGKATAEEAIEKGLAVKGDGW